LKWSDKEDHILKQIYPNPKYSDSECRELLLKILPHRSWSAIRKHASSLGLTRPTGESFINWDALKRLEADVVEY